MRIIFNNLNWLNKSRLLKYMMLIRIWLKNKVNIIIIRAIIIIIRGIILILILIRVIR